VVPLQSGYHSLLCQGEPGSIIGQEIIYLGRGFAVVFLILLAPEFPFKF